MVPVERLDILNDPAEREQFCIDDNVNRRHLTGKQKGVLIDRLLKADPAQSNNSIAKKTNTSDKTVNARRKALEAGSEIPNLKKRTGKDGKEQSAKKIKTTTPEPKQIEQNETERNPVIEIDSELEFASELIKMIEMRTRDKKPKLQSKVNAFIIKALQEESPVIYNAGASLNEANFFIQKRHGHFDKSELKDISKNLCNITRTLISSLKGKDQEALIEAIKKEINAS